MALDVKDTHEEVERLSLTNVREVTLLLEYKDSGADSPGKSVYLSRKGIPLPRRTLTKDDEKIAHTCLR